MERMTRDPVIVMGMHRSGTGILARMLEGIGLFMGTQKDPNNEAWFFLNLNKWIFRQCGASWDHPQPVMDLYEQDAALGVIVDHLQAVCTSAILGSYLGRGRYLRYRHLDQLDVPWGWKDPRNIWTLPVWLKLFPLAKVIYIHRNGVHVAESLKRRSEATLSMAGKRFQRPWRLLPFMRKKGPDLLDSVACLSNENGFQLWEAYCQTAHAHIQKLPQERVLEIRYEDMLQDPKACLEKAGDFADLAASQTAITRAAEMVRTPEISTRETSQEITAAVNESPWMSRYGYSC